MPGIGIGVGIGMKKQGKPYPTEGLQVIVYNQTYEDGGTTYYKTSIGVGLPLISGTGLDAIIDFAPLNDDRFDKGSYVGNALGLPEYYNFPYEGIYYDDTSEDTRYHWKMTDFAYAVILNQTVDENIQNVFFLKAKATTNTSNEIASVSGLYIYATSLADLKLSKMKSYIGIQADFYGDNLIKNGDFSQDSDADGLCDNWNAVIAGSLGTVSTTINNNAQKLMFTEDLGASYFSLEQIAIGTVGKLYRVSFCYKSNKKLTNRMLLNYSNLVVLPASETFECYEENIIASQNYGRFVVYSPDVDDYFEIKEVVVQLIYQNYYKS